MPRPRPRFGRTAMPDRSAMPPRRSWPTMCSSTCSPKPSPASRRPRRRWSGPRSGPTATTESEKQSRPGAPADTGALRSHRMTTETHALTPARKRASPLARFAQSRNPLGIIFLLPTAILLLLFLTYPLGLGVWLGFTDARLGRPGIFVGLDNYELLWTDDVFWLVVFNTVLYTVVASVLKFGLGLWLALLLNERLPFKAFFRAIVLLPWVVPTVLSAIAFWWIYDAQFSILSWALIKLGLISGPINFLGDPTNARASVIAANVWRGIPFVAISLL